MCIRDSIIAAYEDAVAAPQIRGVHGLPGRPWVGRAVADYGVWAARSGHSARRVRHAMERSARE